MKKADNLGGNFFDSHCIYKKWILAKVWLSRSAKQS